jgi:hypothetical protein
MKFNQCRMTLRNLSPQPRVGKLRPKDSLTWQIIVLETSNWMTTVRLRKLKLSFLTELFVTRIKYTRGQETHFRTTIQKIFWDEQETTFSKRNQICRELTCYNDVTPSQTHHCVPLTRKVPWNLLYCEGQTTQVWQWAPLLTTPNWAVPHLQH